MKLTVKRKELLQGLKWVGKACPTARRASLLILSYAELTCRKDNTIGIRATDLDMTTSVELQGKVDLDPDVKADTGTELAIVDFWPLFEAVKNATTEDTTIEVIPKAGSDNLRNCIVTHGVSTWTLNTLPVEDYPVALDLSKAKPDCGCTLEPTDAKRLLAKTAYCMSGDETRPHICQLHIEVSEPGKAMAVATDGHRIAKAETACSESRQGEMGIPVPAVMAFASLVADKKAEPVWLARYTISGVGYVAIESGPYLLTAKANSSDYPSWDRVVPKRASRFLLKLNTKALTAALKAVMPNDRTGGVKIQVTELDELEIYSDSPDTGFSKTTLRLEEPLTEPLKPRGINAHYLLDILHGMNGSSSTIEIGAEGPPDPLVVREIDAVSVFMPMRV